MRQRVKCVTDSAGYALYFSRGALPWNKDGEVRAYPKPWADKPYLLHLGLQCYDRHFLTEYCRMAPTPLMVNTCLTQPSKPTPPRMAITYLTLLMVRTCLVTPPSSPQSPKPTPLVVSTSLIQA